MNNFYIYKIIEINSGMFYFGQRRCPANKTPETDPYMSSNRHIKNMIKQFGLDGYKKVILFKNLSQDEVDKKEIELISSHQLLRIEGKKSGKLCMNHHPGGNMGEIRINTGGSK